MRSIANLMRSVANLAGSINALAGVLDVATDKLRQQLALDESPTVLEHDAAGGDNAGLDSSANGTAKGRRAKSGTM